MNLQIGENMNDFLEDEEEDETEKNNETTHSTVALSNPSTTTDYSLRFYAQTIAELQNTVNTQQQEIDKRDEMIVHLEMKVGEITNKSQEFVQKFADLKTQNTQLERTIETMVSESCSD